MHSSLCAVLLQAPDESEQERRLNASLLETYRAKASVLTPGGSGGPTSRGGRGSGRFF